MDQKTVNKAQSSLMDMDLHALASVANQGLTVGISFYSDGFFFVGTMISGNEYYETTIKNLKASGESGEAISVLFETISVMYQPENVQRVPNDYIFLKGVKSHGAFNTDFGEGLFKFKISEISGYTIGVPKHLKC